MSVDSVIFNGSFAAYNITISLIFSCHKKILRGKIKSERIKAQKLTFSIKQDSLYRGIPVENKKKKLLKVN